MRLKNFKKIVNSTMIIIDLVAALFTIYSFFTNFITGQVTCFFLSIFLIGLIFFIVSHVYNIFRSNKTPKQKITVALDLADNFHDVIDTYKNVKLELFNYQKSTNKTSEFKLMRAIMVSQILIQFNGLFKEAGIRKSHISIKLFRDKKGSTLYTLKSLLAHCWSFYGETL